MSYAVIFLILSAALTVLGLHLGGGGLLLAWLGLDFALTGIGHLTTGGRLYGKRPNGGLPLWSRLLYAPFLLYTWSVWQLLRRLSREPATSRVTDFLVIGRRLLPQEASEQFANWVDLTAEFGEPQVFRTAAGYVALPILDGGTPTVSEIRTVIDQLRPGSTYVHCAQGHGRTGLFALILLHRQGIIANLDDGLRLLQSVRPALNLNRRQKQFVRDYLRTTQGQP